MRIPIRLRLTVVFTIAMAILLVALGAFVYLRVSSDLLASVDLSDKARDVPPRLSGGERQRVAVARAFANDPAVILADEPPGSLDDDATRAVLGLLRAHAARGGTVLAVTHDPRFIAAADRVVSLAPRAITS